MTKGELAKRPDRSWNTYCHWCGEKQAVQGCKECKHTFCDDCWHPSLGCPRCAIEQKSK